MWILHCNVLVSDCILSKYKLLHCLVKLVALKCSDLRLITLQQILTSYITQLHWIQQVLINYNIPLHQVKQVVQCTHSRNWIIRCAQNRRTALQMQKKNEKWEKKWQCFEYHIWKASVPMLSLLLFDITYDSIYGFVSISHRVE